MNSKSLILITILLIISQITTAVTESQRTKVISLLKQSDWSTAIDLAEKLIEEQPQNSQAHFLLAKAIRLKMQEVSQIRAMFSIGDYKEALATAIKLDPNNVDARIEEIRFYLFAPSIAGGDTELATEKIKALKAVDQIKGMEMEAELAGAKGDQVKAEKILEELILLKPNNPSSLMQLGIIAMQKKNYLQADQYLTKITAEEDPGWPLIAQYQRAKARILARQDADMAITLLEEYQKTSATIQSELNLPDDAIIFWRMAMAHEIKGNKAKAISLLQQSVELNSEFEPAQEHLDRLTD